MYDYSLFYKKTLTSAVYMTVYVDDIVLTGTDADEIADLKVYLNKNFKIKDLGLIYYSWEWRCFTQIMELLSRKKNCT